MGKPLRGLGVALLLVLAGALLWWILDPAEPDADRPGRAGSAAREGDSGVALGPDDRGAGETSRDRPEAEPETALLTGVVHVRLNGAGRTVAGARVRVYRRPDLFARAPWLRTWFNLSVLHLDGVPRDLFAETTADEEGRFAVEAPVDVDCLVVADRGDLAPDHVRGRAGGDEVHVWLVPSRSRTLVVHDPDGNAVVGAEVYPMGRIYGQQETFLPMSRHETDAAGSVTLLLRAGGAVVVRAKGYATRWVRDALGRESDVVVLEPATDLAGSVVDERDQPVEGASVHVGRWMFGEIAITDAAGRFRFEGLSSARREPLGLLVLKDGFERVREKAAAGDEDVRVVLSRRGNLVGRIVLENGEPAAGATVSFLHPESSRSQSDVPVDDQGRFAIDGVPAGTVVLWTRIERRVGPDGPEYRTHEAYRVIDVTSRERKDVGAIELRGHPVSFVSVRVLGPDGMPAVEATVLDDRKSLGREYSKTDEEGLALRIVAAPPGTRIEIVAHPDDDSPGHASVRSETTTTATPDGPPHVVTLDRLGSRKVRFREEDGSPLPADLAVKLTWIGAHDREWVVTGPHEVTVAVDPNAWLQYRVEAGGRVDVRCAVDPDEVEGDIEVRLARVATLTGRLVGDPETILQAVVAGSGGPDWSSFPEIGPGGRFRIEGVPPGRIHLLASLDHARPTLVCPTEVEAGEEKDVGEVPFPPTGRFRGRVLGPDGGPLRAVYVDYRSSTSEARIFSRARTRPDGTFEIAAVPIPGARLEFTRSGLGRVIRPLPADPAGTMPTVRMMAAARARIRLVPPPPPGGTPRFRVALANGLAWWEPHPKMVASGDGEALWILSGLPSEPIRITCRDDRRMETKREGGVDVRLPPGSLSDVEIRLVPVQK